MMVAIVFLVYTFGGAYMPDVIAHKGQSLHKVMSHQWLTTEGVFGIALGVSTSFVFLFVLFGAMLEQAGAGNYFIKVAFALLGHLKGGPAKAAVVASATTGLISGSSIANVATTGTFTIPLMKRVGFPGTKAGAVEVAASTNGQLTPPVMGAAAFLMIEYVGISYLEVIKHAILPAVISYIALFYIVHLEALKADMQGLPKLHHPTIAQRLMTFAAVVSGICVIGFAVYYGIGWIKDVAGDAAIYIVGVLVTVAYVGLLKFATTYPELQMDDPDDPVLELPETGPTVKAGLYFLLPIVVLMWCLIVERFSPGPVRILGDRADDLHRADPATAAGLLPRTRSARPAETRLYRMYRRPGAWRTQHDRHRRCHRGRRHHRRHHHADRHRPGDDRVRRIHLGRLPDAGADLHRDDLHHPRAWACRPPPTTSWCPA